MFYRFVLPCATLLQPQELPSCLSCLYNALSAGHVLTIARLVMGGTLTEDNIRGRVIFLLEPGYITDSHMVSNVEKKSLHHLKAVM